MIKHYLVPAEMVIDSFSNEPLRRPKYLKAIGVNWAGVYVESKDVFVVVVNTKTSLNSKHNELSGKTDVIVLNGERDTKDLIKTKLGLSKKIRNDEDEVEVVARLQEKGFKKDREHLWVSE